MAWSSRLLKLETWFLLLHPQVDAPKWGWTSPILEVLMRDEAPRAVTAICRALEEQIEHGLLPSGSQLPAERKLSEVFDTTRITLREVLGARLIPASAEICQLLALPALSSVYQIRRARRIDGRLVLYVEHYLNPNYFAGILDFD